MSNKKEMKPGSFVKTKKKIYEIFNENKYKIFTIK